MVVLYWWTYKQSFCFLAHMVCK